MRSSYHCYKSYGYYDSSYDTFGQIYSLMMRIDTIVLTILIVMRISLGPCLSLTVKSLYKNPIPRE